MGSCPLLNVTIHASAKEATADPRRAGVVDTVSIQASAKEATLDRAAILRAVVDRLRPGSAHPANWMLVATSLVEAGVDISFRSAFRERFSLASLIQTGGRVNRHGEADEPGAVHDFLVGATEGLTLHPAAAAPGHVLERFFCDGLLDGDFSPAALVTRAMAAELRGTGGAEKNPLRRAEAARDYPEAAEEGRVIATGTRLVIVDPALKERLSRAAAVSSRDLLEGSVQLWAEKIEQLALEPVTGRPGVYWWPHPYDGAFLGYMEGALGLEEAADASLV